MAIYVIYAGRDGESYMRQVQIADTYEDTLPCLGWRTIARPAVGEPNDWHVAKANGSVQLILRGRIEIGVSAGSLRDVVGLPGDCFVFVDTQGKGHRAHRNGEDAFEAVNIRIAPDWDALRQGFSGWPDDAVPFEGVSLGGA